MRASLLLSVFLGFTFACASTIAQTSGPDGSIRTHIQGIDIPAVAGAPFTAKVLVTWDEPLVGGGTISRKYYTLVARDAQGRVHRETRDFVPANSSAEPPLRSFSIADPVAATRTTCTQSTMMCTTAEFHPRVSLTGEPDTDQAGGSLPPNGGKINRVSLGEQTIGQLRVVGTRETATSVAGDNGSDRMIVSHRDLWYSPDLHMDISVVRSNPQMGQLTLTVTDLVRGNPDPSWFSVPSGYQNRNAYIR
jgi:hypothetical protein